ncbi:UDP-N-acetylmuramoyl-tripeptide--D-alanyl-D-alanine ligase [Georgenia thermotolerans]|uniref:UDP-N-acetylmuramoyl-tripeptide--D-alanyl-D-alanine ligase n=1 Tax=Georgenia thermotolerans TaxID=527326 RepID=A0A7J5UJ07_9MICO|nr:UDP-N-acetylmuramoyl-tripeptide--D-alanyl-D-alanine ligase [Georgenia thermotolerans]KAE8762369.1 UDP-N-acetylmuramoyl-tripeptide--D-alanyl-D-alanine ligase [Georgenia thermotolerans]
MITMTLAEVAAVTGGHLAAEAADVVVDGDVVTDSRAAGPGTLFAAFAGEHVDGHDYVAAALAAGAAGALVSDTRALGHVDPARLVVVDDVAAALGALARHVLAALRARRGPDDPLRVVAVTGSVGKTTTKDLLARLLEPLGERIAPPGSFNNEIGLPLTVLRASETTRTLVLEMGADHVGNIAYLTSVAPPDVAVVLVVGRAHLGEFGGIDNVARAKSELVTGLLPTGTAVLNADDARVAAMAPLAPGRVVTFGRSAGDVRAEDVTLDDAGRAAFTLAAGDERAAVRLALVGEHHVTNALAAATVALELGLALPDVAAALAGAGAASPHRMDVRMRPDGVRIVDDSYNANPDSMRAGLRALVALAGPPDGAARRVAVLGEMLELGEDSAAEHAALGADAARLGVDLLLAVGAGTAPLADGARGAGARTEVLEVPDVDAARERLEALLRPGDTVLLKGSNGSGIWRLADDLLTVATADGVMPA